MAVPVLVATSGASNANSYCTVAEATTYHESHLYSTDWTSASTDTKTIALIHATREIEARFEWVSFPTSQDQALQWPRSSILKRGGIDYYDNDVVPPEIKNAVSEYARQLIAGNRSADYDVETKGLRSLIAGPISLEFKDSATARPVPDAVLALIPSWWGWLANRGMRPLLRA
jgi:hypothetical protein